MKCIHPYKECHKTPATTEWGNVEACNCDLVEAMERDFGQLPNDERAKSYRGEIDPTMTTIWTDVFDTMQGDDEGNSKIKRWFVNKDAEHEQGEFNLKSRPIKRDGRSLRINYFSGWVRISRFSEGVQHGM